MIVGLINRYQIENLAYFFLTKIGFTKCYFAVTIKALKASQEVMHNSNPLSDDFGGGAHLFCERPRRERHQAAEAPRGLLARGGHVTVIRDYTNYPRAEEITQ